MSINLDKETYTKDEVSKFLTEQESSYKSEADKLEKEFETKKKDLEIQITKEQKDTHYGTIEYHKKQVDELSKQKDELMKKLSELESAGTKKQEDTVESQKEIQELKGQIETIKGETKRLLDEQSAYFNGVLQKKDLEMIKKELISTAKGEIIPELVTGNTEEEIRASYETAVNRYKEITEVVKKGQENKHLLEGKAPEASGGDRATEKGSSTREADYLKVMSMSKEEFLKYQEDQFNKLGIK